MNFLRSIIAVNSYRGHKINQFRVDDGALIQGSNGAGKTSILRLLLLFFGASAREIASISGKNNRFADYYLPSTKSYLVYQYKKGNQDFLVIAFAKGRNEVTYYFCEGSFDEGLFLNSAGQFIDCSEIKSHIQTVMKRKVSPAFSWSQYKEVIQSGKRTSGRDRDSQKINEAKLKFSLCEPNQSLDNIEKIAVSILANKPSFHAIRSLIADGILGLDAFLSEDFGSNFHSSYLIQQRNLLRQAKRFKEKKPILDEIRTASSLMTTWDKEKEILGSRILQSWHYYSELLAEAISRKNNFLHEKSETEDTHRYQLEQLFNQIGELKGEQKTPTNRLETLDKQFNDYQKNRIDEKQQLVQQLPHLTEQVGATKAEKELLESNFQHITKQYEIAESEAEKRELKQREELNAAFNQKKDLIDQQEREFNSQHSEKQASIYAHFDSRREELSEKLNQQRDEKSDIQLKIQQPISPLTQQIEADLAKLQIQIDDNSQNQTQLLQSLNTHQNQLNTTENQRNSALSELERIKSSIVENNQTLEENTEDLKHLEQTFYYQLNSLSQEKAELAARVLRKEVLKTPLKYQLELTGDHNDVLGLNLDFTQFPAQLISDKTELQKQVAEIGKTLRELDISKTAKEGEILTLNQSFENQRNVLANVEQQLRELDTDLQRVTKRQTEMKQNLEVEKQKLVLELEDEKQLVENKIQSLVVEKNSLQTQQQAQLELSKKHLTEKLDGIAQQRVDEKTLLDGELQRLANETKQELKRINDSKTKDLKDAGARAEEISNLSLQLQELTNKLENAQSAKSEVEKYTIWFESEYSEKPKLEKLLTELTSKLEQLDIQKSEMENRHEEVRENLKKRLEALNKEVDESDQETKNFELLLENYFRCENLMPSDNESILVSKIAREEVASLNLNLAEQDKKGQDGYKSFMHALRNRDNQELSERLREMLIENGLSEIESTQNWRDLIESLEYVMRTIDGLITATQQEFHTIAGDVIGLDAKLETIGQRIIERGRSISNKLNQSGTAFSNIESIEARISSNIESLGFRSALRQAADEARKVQRLPSHEELPEAYFEKLSWALKQIERYGRGMKLEQFIDVELAVKNTGVIQLRRARNDKELKDISSEGLSFLILISLYMAIKNTFGESQNVKLVWAIDEIGKLHPDNIEILMRILKEERVDFFCAEPRTDPQILSQFRHIYEITEKGNIIKVQSDSPKTAGEAFLEAAGG
ncbi:ATP-binding protein [Thiomicrorhabdus hydrogeniphila]